MSSLCLKVSIGLVMVLSAIELSFISATVGYLAQLEKTTIPINTDGGDTVRIAGLPASLLVDQGHTSNGAAGTGLIVVGCAGILALYLRGRRGQEGSGLRLGRLWYRLWLALTVPALLLTLGALAYVFAVTRMHDGQTIDVGAGAGAGASDNKYPVGTWTPQGWLGALLAADLAEGAGRADIERHYRIARGWEYNLIPMFLAQLVQTAMAFLDALKRRRAEEQLLGHGGGDKFQSYAGYGGK